MSNKNKIKRVPRALLPFYNCTICKHNSDNYCSKYTNCDDCPMTKGGTVCCLCLQLATEEEALSRRCMYFEEEPAND